MSYQAQNKLERRGETMLIYFTCFIVGFTCKILWDEFKGAL